MVLNEIFDVAIAAKFKFVLINRGLNHVENS